MRMKKLHLVAIDDKVAFCWFVLCLLASDIDVSILIECVVVEKPAAKSGQKTTHDIKNGSALVKGSRSGGGGGRLSLYSLLRVLLTSHPRSLCLV